MSISLQATHQILNTIASRNLTESDVVFVLISGGGSALLPDPIPGLTLEQKQDIITKLSRSGADIFELNTVRKALSNVKAGKLAAKLYPAKVNLVSNRFVIKSINIFFFIFPKLFDVRINLVSFINSS